MLKLAFLCTVLCASLVGQTPIQHFQEVHLLERLSVAFPEDEKNNWNFVCGNEGEEGRVFELWEKQSSNERLVIVTSPWGEETPSTIEQTLAAMMRFSPGYVEVIRQTKGEDEMILAFHCHNQWEFVRLIITPYALHIGSYSFTSEETIDPETYLSILDEYVLLVY